MYRVYYRAMSTDGTTVEYTTAKMRVTTWRRVQALKERPGESIDDVIVRLLEQRESAQEQPQKAAS